MTTSVLRWPGVLSTAGVLLAAPVEIAAGQSTGQHPDPAYLVAPSPTRTVAFDTPPRTIPITLAAGVLATIGSEDGDAAMVFGRITDAIFVDDTTVAILDNTVEEIRLFTTRGRHLQTIGRAGSGPGEFRGASSLFVRRNGELMVGEARRSVQALARGASGFEHRRTTQLPVAIRSMCDLGGTLYASGASFDSGSVVRAIDDAGRVTKAFGAVYRSPNPLINYQVAQGHVACDADHDLILYTPGALFGEVRAFRTSGEEAWRVSVTNYRRNTILDTKDGARVVRSPAGANAVAGLTLVGRGGLLAQWHFISQEEMEAKAAPTTVHSVWIDLSTGAPTYAGTALGRVLDVRGDLVLEVIEEPVPQLRIRRFSRT